MGCSWGKEGNEAINATGLGRDTFQWKKIFASIKAQIFLSLDGRI
jgi:hypothetical protein